MDAPDNPLSEQHYQQLVDGLAAAQRGLAHIELAKRAGIEVSAAEAQLLDTQSRLLKIKQVYFPNR